MFEGAIDLLRPARTIRAEDGLRMEKDFGIESGESRALLEGEREGKDVVHRKGDESPIPEAHLARIVEDGFGGKMVGAADVGVGVVLKVVAAPEPVKGTVDRAATMAGVDANASLDVERAIETVASGSAASGNAGGAARSFVIAVFVKPFGDVGNGLDERGALL